MLERLYELQNSDAFALHDANNHMTYRELFKRSQAIAYFLSEKTDLYRTVGIYGDKDNNVVAAFIGSMMAGKVYVMLPMSYPLDRIKGICQDCQPDIIFNISDNNLEIDCTRIVTREEVATEWNGKYEGKDIIKSNNDNLDELAVILYTSGTTGKPRGVKISYRNIQSVIDLLLTHDVYELDREETRWKEAGLASYSFSVGLFFYGILGYFGGEYFSVPTEIIINSGKLLNYLIDTQPFGFTLTPSLLKSMLSFEKFCESKLHAMRLLCLGGEPLTKDLSAELIKRFPNIKMANCYGLTETAGSFVNCELTQEAIDASEHFMPVSSSNVEFAFLLDENNTIIKEEGEIGEFCFAGDMVTLGYYNNPSLTEKSYFIMPDGRRAFRTGDRGIIRNGYMFIINRADNMVKIGGNRVEIEEVEKHLSTCNPVSECAVAVKTDSKGNNSLVGFIVKSEKYNDRDEIEIYMQIQDEMMAKLEPYKVPRKIVVLDKLPRNINGKLDRAKLARRANS